MCFQGCRTRCRYLRWYKRSTPCMFNLPWKLPGSKHATTPICPIKVNLVYHQRRLLLPFSCLSVLKWFLRQRIVTMAWYIPTWVDFATWIWGVGVDTHFSNISSSPWCPFLEGCTIIYLFSRVDIPLSQRYFYRPVLTLYTTTTNHHLGDIVWFIGTNIILS